MRVLLISGDTVMSKWNFDAATEADIVIDIDDGEVLKDSHGAIDTDEGFVQVHKS